MLNLWNSSLFQSSTSTKTKSTAWFLKARKLQLLQSLFCVEICSRYRPSFCIGVSEKYFKPTLKIRCDTIGLHLHLSTCPKQPLFEGGATPPPPNYVNKNIRLSKQHVSKCVWRLWVFQKSYVGEGSYEIPYTISKPSCNSIIKFLSSPVWIFSGLHLVKPHYVIKFISNDQI